MLNLNLYIFTTLWIISNVKSLNQSFEIVFNTFKIIKLKIKSLVSFLRRELHRISFNTTIEYEINCTEGVAIH
jgi:hypothetical protein